MKPFSLCIGMLLASIFPAATSAEPLDVLTEEYPPFNLKDADGQITGLSTKILEEMFRRAGVEYKLTLLALQCRYFHSARGSEQGCAG